MIAMQEIAAHFKDIAFKDDANLHDLLTIALAFAVFWFVALWAAAKILLCLTFGRAWLRDATEKEYERSYDRKMMEEYGLITKNTTKKEIIDDMMKSWAEFQPIMLQHVVGALLCVPSMMGMGDPLWASSLAVMGVLSETGWEWSHIVQLINQKFFTKGGHTKMPTIVFCIFMLHHSLGSNLGIPVVLHYRHLRAVHWGELMGA